jgi:hypothetical protein
MVADDDNGCGGKADALIVDVVAWMPWPAAGFE